MRQEHEDKTEQMNWTKRGVKTRARIHKEVINWKNTQEDKQEVNPWSEKSESLSSASVCKPLRIRAEPDETPGGLDLHRLSPAELFIISCESLRHAFDVLLLICRTCIPQMWIYCSCD